MTSSTDADSSESARPARPERPAAERRVRPDRARSDAPVAPRERTGKPVRRKSEGQWALGYREPLNANEQSKKDDNPLNVRARIENIYSKQGFGSIDKSDLRGRMRWWGLYTQREQGYDGTFTGDENIDLLEAEYFMMRVRCDSRRAHRAPAAHPR